MNTIKISENKYNGHYSTGSIFENSINIAISNDLFHKNIEKITKDKILSAKFRRSFMDNNLNLISIEIPSPIIENPDTLLHIIEEIVKPEYEIQRDQKFNLRDYLEKLTITINGSEIEYEISKNSELGKILMEVSGLDIMIKKSNKEIIESINI